MQKRARCRAWSALSLLAAGAGAAADPPSFTGLGDVAPGSTNSRAQAISGDGLVVTGRCTPSNQQRVFKWTQGGGMVNLGGPNLAIGCAASADGSVIVGYNATTSGDAQAFRWTAAGFEALLAMGSQSPGPRAFAVSADGSVSVGESNTSFSAIAVRWAPAGVPQALSNEPGFTYSSASGVSANGAVVVGRGSSPAIGNVAFRWTSQGGMVGLPDFVGGPVAAAANAISGDGHITVGYATSDTGQEAATWNGGGPIGLGDLDGGAFESSALAISFDGGVIVGYGTTDVGQEAFVWDAIHGMRNLRTVLADVGVTGANGWTLMQATGVSADGAAIVGIGINPSGETEAWLARLPVSGPCYANCDGSSVPPILNAQDFFCFMNLFAVADSTANCDHSTAPPTLNVIDFMCFINAFAAGCS